MKYRLTSYLLLLLLGVGAIQAQPNPANQQDLREPYLSVMTPELVKGHVFFLADDLLEGRETGERGQHLAGLYIRAQFMRMGLQPGNPVTQGYFQPYYLNTTRVNKGSMTVKGTEFAYRKGFINGKGGLFETGSYDLVYAGYGTSEETANAEVEGKVAVIFAGGEEGPEEESLFGKIQRWKKRHAPLIEKGAEGTLMVLPDSVFSIMRRYARKKSTTIDAENKASAPLLYVSEEMAQELFKASKSSLKKVQVALAEGKTPKVKWKPGALEVNSDQEFSSNSASNVMGYLPGTDLADELLVITGHYDHIGIGRDGDINNGADDDASGTTTVLAVAEAFARAAADGYRPRRSILFMTVSGEEKGLLGSAFYTDHPLYPLEKTVTNLNIDMVGRIDGKYSERPDSLSYVYVIGSDRLSTTLHQTHEEVNQQYGGLTLDYTYNEDDDPNRFYYRSDHYNFAKNGIPVIFYFNGTHPDYHKPGDDPEKIRLEKVARVARLVFATAWEVANMPERPEVDGVIEN